MPSPFENLLPRYDAVVIGAGLGGMTAANNLAKFGRKVLLLEHHYQLGGLATFFKRAGGHVFDISLHGFPHGMIKSTRRYWTKEISDRIHAEDPKCIIHVFIRQPNDQTQAPL